MLLELHYYSATTLCWLFIELTLLGNDPIRAEGVGDTGSYGLI